MSTPTASPTSTGAKPALPLGLLLGIAALIGVLLLPLPADLPVAGHRVLAILAFAVVVWISEAVSYEASAIMITSLLAFLLGTAPTLADPSVIYGSSAAVSMALTGFANPALALVVGALFIAAAMTHTGLDRRIALVTLDRVGVSTRRILLGAMVVIFLLSLVVPSATARSACVVPIMMGVIAAFGVDKRSNIAAGIMIIVAQGTSIWNIGIQTAAAQNLLTVGFMDKMLGARVSWIDWLIAGAPWALIMSVVLIVLVLTSLVTLTLFSAFRTGIKAWHTAEDHLQRVEGARQLLHEQARRARGDARRVVRVLHRVPLRPLLTALSYRCYILLSMERALGGATV